ncbi:Gamma-aminobutyric acid type B receptor subunit 2 [Dermatophagoides farinae]|uniref:Gamma-aminobutyric acid type B receptor subunit 2 n=1 Tax=Dermatophagoides farinae TaxID=6954 RepID=A0A922HN59_DERFA|nr:Gamma-aminobutyric acid type B receptor subunit 2 [Dermatophagoides farinae]
MSSPYLNNLIIIGCILTYTSVILLGLNSGLTSENNFPYICASRAWVLMTGFTLAFGSQKKNNNNDDDDDKMSK